jgi:transposase-like protein
LALDRDELKKLLKEKGVKSLDDFNAFMREISKEVVETTLDGELTDHLGYEKHDQKTKTTNNARNGFTPKAVKSKFGEIDLDVLRDRKSDFEPQIVKKRQKDISGLEEKIIIKDLYGYKISPDEEAAKKWTFRHRDWAMICSQPMIFFGNRLGERD